MLAKNPKLPDANVRVLRFERRHYEQCLRIERASFDDPWGKAHFNKALSDGNVRMFVAERQQQVLGYIVMHDWPRHIDLWNVAVEPESRLLGIGALLVGMAKSRLEASCRELVRVDVRETNLGAQLFFRQIGFRALGYAPGCRTVADPTITFDYTLGPIDGVDVLRNLLEGDGRRLDS